MKVLFALLISLGMAQEFIDLGNTKIPRLTDTQINQLSRADLELHLKTYYTAFFWFYQRQWAKVTGKAPQDLPQSLVENLIKDKLKLSTDELRGINHQFYAPGGVAKINQMLLHETASATLDWEKKKYGLVLPRQAQTPALTPSQVANMIQEANPEDKKFILDTIQKSGRPKSEVVAEAPPAAPQVTVAAAATPPFESQKTILMVGLMAFAVVVAVWRLRSKKSTRRSR